MLAANGATLLGAQALLDRMKTGNRRVRFSFSSCCSACS